MSILVDTPPDLRTQCLTYGVRRVDAVFLTHNHADHLFGFDDLRQFNRLQKNNIDVYLSSRDKPFLLKVFGYAFSKNSCGLVVPRVRLKTIERFEIKGMRITSITVNHGPSDARGYVFETPNGKRLAYIPDCKRIDEATASELHNLDVLILDTLRLRKPHVSHMLLEDSLKAIKRLNPAAAYLTHVNHDIGRHEKTQRLLPENIYIAYDGLEVRI